MIRITPPEDATDSDLEFALRVTQRLPAIADEVRASEAKTDHLDVSDAPTFKMQAVTPAPPKTSAWFEKEEKG